MLPRRHFLGFAGGAATGILLPAVLLPQGAKAQSAPLLDPLTQPRFVNPLPNLLAPNYVYRPTGIDPGTRMPLFDIHVKQIRHDAGLVDPATRKRLRHTAWAYGTALQPAIYPAYSFDLRQGQSVKVRFSNELYGITYPRSVPVDQTIHWADPLNAGNLPNVPYTGPVPLVAHQHGGDTNFLSDGLPDAWATPGNDLRGRLFSPVYTYDNRQESAQLWYHDHAVGLTRLNVYMGLAGNYFIRDENENALGLPKPPYEVPLMIQDRTFLADGELFYAHQDPETPGLPNPTHLPENFGDVVLVNGVAWPLLEVEPRKYRFRVLNASDSRVYDMRLSNRMPFIQIGSDLGLLNAPVELQVLSIAPGERADIVLDFARMQGQTIVVGNSAAAPYPDGDPVDPATAGQVLAFRVNQPLSRVPDRPLPSNLRPVSGPVPELAGARRTAQDPAVRGHRHPRPAADDGRHRRREPPSAERHPGVHRPDHREPTVGRHRDLGVLQQHRGRAPDPHAPGRLPPPQPAEIQRHGHAQDQQRWFGRRRAGRGEHQVHGQAAHALEG
jgi:spore coat protein A